MEKRNVNLNFLLVLINFALIGLMLFLFLDASLKQSFASGGTNYYVRNDGDNSCNGQYDADSSATPNCAWKTITYAVGQVQSEDIINVAVGTYDQNGGETFQITVPAGVTLQGPGIDDLANVAEITGDGAEMSRIITLSSNATIDGFKLTGMGSNQYQGISISDAQGFTISNNMFVGNQSSDDNWGIFGEGGSAQLSGTIEDNIIYNVGQAIRIDGSNYNANVVVNKNTFYNNNSAVTAMESNASIKAFNNIFKGNNTAVDQGNSGSLESDFNLFHGNTANYGGGIVAGSNDLTDPPCFVTVSGNSAFQLLENSEARDEGCTYDTQTELCEEDGTTDIGAFWDASTYTSDDVYVATADLDGDDGNGGTSWGDAYLTIQNAIDQFPSGGNCYTVNIGTGTFSPTSEINVGNYVATLKGVGTGSSIIDITTTDNELILGESSGSLTVEDLAITGSAGHGVLLRGDNSAVTDCEIYGANISGPGVKIEGADNVAISNTVLRDLGSHVIYIDNGRSTTVSHSIFYNNDTGPAAILRKQGGETPQINFTDNIFAGNAGGYFQIDDQGEITSNYNIYYQIGGQLPDGVSFGAQDKQSTNPYFVDGDNQDFRVYSISEAVGTASDSTNIGLYQGAGVAGGPWQADKYAFGLGDDDNCDGNSAVAYPGSGTGQNCAYRSITQALVYASETVQVGTGTYNADGGETFPLAVGQNITLQGVDAASVTVDGGQSDRDVLSIADGATIDGFTITGIRTEEIGVGIMADAAHTFTITDNIFVGPDMDGEARGVYVNNLSGEALGTINSNRFYNLSKGIEATHDQNGSGEITVTANHNVFYSTYIGASATNADTVVMFASDNIFMANEYGLAAVNNAILHEDGDYNLYSDNDSDYGGDYEGAANDITETNPRFVNAASYDFRVYEGSAALNAASDSTNIGWYQGAGVSGSPYGAVSYVSAENGNDTYCLGTSSSAYSEGVTDCAFATITNALAYASETVYVGPGTYNEYITMQDDVDLISTDGYATTIINGYDEEDENDTVVTFSEISSATTFSGFTVTTNDDFAVGVYLEGCSNVTILDSSIEGFGGSPTLNYLAPGAPGKGGTDDFGDAGEDDDGSVYLYDGDGFKSGAATVVPAPLEDFDGSDNLNVGMISAPAYDIYSTYYHSTDIASDCSTLLTAVACNVYEDCEVEAVLTCNYYGENLFETSTPGTAGGTYTWNNDNLPSGTQIMDGFDSSPEFIKWTGSLSGGLLLVSSSTNTIQNTRFDNNVNHVLLYQVSGNNQFIGNVIATAADGGADMITWVPAGTTNYIKNTTFTDEDDAKISGSMALSYNLRAQVQTDDSVAQSSGAGNLVAGNTTGAPSVATAQGASAVSGATVSFRDVGSSEVATATTDANGLTDYSLLDTVNLTRGATTGSSQFTVTATSNDLTGEATVTLDEASETVTITMASSDQVAPVIQTRSPESGATDVDESADIEIKVYDASLGVDPSTATMTVNGESVTVGYVAVSEPSIYLFYPQSLSSFNAGQTVEVAISVQDLASIPNTMTASYSFEIESAQSAQQDYVMTPKGLQTNAPQDRGGSTRQNTAPLDLSDIFSDDSEEETEITVPEIPALEADEEETAEEGTESTEEEVEISEEGEVIEDETALKEEEAAEEFEQVTLMEGLKDAVDEYHEAAAEEEPPVELAVDNAVEVEIIKEVEEAFEEEVGFELPEELVVVAEEEVPEFKDVEGHWSEEYVKALSKLAMKVKVAEPAGEEDEEGLKGSAASVQKVVVRHVLEDFTGENELKPDQGMTKAELAKMIMLAFGHGIPEKLPETDKVLSDVPRNNSERSRVIYWGIKKGIFHGNDNGTFTPEKTLNRAETLKMLYEAAGIQISINPFLSYLDNFGYRENPTEVSTTEWYAKYVLHCITYDICQGCRLGYFCPTKKVTRAEAMKLLINVIDHRSDL